MVFVLISLLALFVVLAFFVWWQFDIDLSDLVASSVTPAVGIVLIYFHSSMLTLIGGLILLAIGIFSLVYLVRRRSRPASLHRTRD